MFRNDSTKKVHKKFADFVDEEQWLQHMLFEGWILTKYSNEDEFGCYYIFKPVAKKISKT